MRNSLRSSLRSSFDPHSDPPSEEPPRQSSTTFRSSLPSSSIRPSLRSQAGPRSLEAATESESDCHPARHIRCRSRGPRTRNSLACMVTPQGSCHQCREWQGEQGCGLGMEDMTGELRLVVLRKDCFAGCNDDDATTTQLATTCKVPSQVAGEDRSGRDDATTR